MEDVAILVPYDISLLKTIACVSRIYNPLCHWHPQICYGPFLWLEVSWSDRGKRPSSGQFPDSHRSRVLMSRWQNAKKTNLTRLKVISFRLSAVLSLLRGDRTERDDIIQLSWIWSFSGDVNINACVSNWYQNSISMILNW